MCCKYFARYLRTFSGGTCLGSFSHCVSCALSSIASTALFLLRFGTALSSCYLWLPFSTVPFYISSALSCCFLSCYLLVLLSFGYLRLVLSPFCSTCSGYKSERAHPAPLSVYLKYSTCSTRDCETFSKMFKHLEFPNESLSAQTMDFDLISWSLDIDTAAVEQSSSNMDILSYDTEVN